MKNALKVTPRKDAYDVKETVDYDRDIVLAKVGVEVSVNLDYMMDFIVDHWRGLDPTTRHTFARKVSRLNAIDDYALLKGERPENDDDKEFMW